MIFINPIRVGCKEYSFEEVMNGKGVCDKVNLYDGVDYVTSFPNVEEMKEYLFHDVPAVVIEEIETLKRFRKKCETLLGSDYNYMNGTIGQEEKKRNQEMFMKRLNILKGEMSNPQFGKIVGIHHCTLYNLMVGARAPGLNILKRIAEQCGVTVDWLMGE